MASQVNLVLGEYTRAQTDLAVKVPGGGVGAERRYYGNAWHFEHTRHNLVIKPALIGGGIESVEKAGVTYTASALDSDLFLHDTYRIRKTATGFRWEEKSGGFKEFDVEGRMTSYGGRNGVIGRLSYAGGRVAGASDRNNPPVLWYEWAGERIVAERLHLDRNKVTRPGRYPDTVETRSVLCYWAARELKITTVELSRRLSISQPTASQSVMRGERVVVEKKLELIS